MVDSTMESTCMPCKGTGHVHVGPTISTAVCPACKGTGKLRWRMIQYLDRDTGNITQFLAPQG